MSKNKNTKVVQIKEDALVTLIDNILSEAIKEKQKEWIAEQEAKSNSILENKIIELEKKINQISESKKVVAKKAAPKKTK